MRLGVIPARGGSKRIPRKNVRPFCGKPMIGWSIEAAHASGCFDRIIVSTDDVEIADVARACGAYVPFLRPAELADDHSGITPVVAHAIDWQNRHGDDASQVCCVLATAPFLQAADLQRGLEILGAKDCDYAFAVTRYAFPVQRAIRLTGTGRVQMLHPEHYHSRSQDLEETFHDAGQFYWGRAEAWLSGRALFSADAAAVVLPRWRVQDIDTPEDWEYAERMFRIMQPDVAAHEG